MVAQSHVSQSVVVLLRRLAGLVLFMATGAAASDPEPGMVVYREHCASCHDNAEATKSPPLDILNRMPPGNIANALVMGKMQPQGAKLTAEEIAAVSGWLGAASSAELHTWVEKMWCEKDRAKPDLAARPIVTTFGFDLENSRALSYEETGFDGASLRNLELAWALAFPDVVSMRSQAAVVGNTLFLPVGESRNRLFALDIGAAEPCIQWLYEAERTLRSSASFGTLPDGRKAVLVGDMGGYVHVLDAATGNLIWQSSAGLFAESIITGTPVLHGERVYVPSSQYEIMVGRMDTHVCCKTHGGVVALDALSGKRVWEMHTMEHAKPLRDRGDGQMLWGPSGAPIWNSPSIDVKRGQLYVGTGEATSPPAHHNTDALLAIDLDDGSINWSFQATANDIFLVGCGSRARGKNCVEVGVETVYRDVDFGASAIIARRPDGEDVILAGQKSGTVWAMDPDTGEVIWRTDIGTGGGSGGIHWGIAADDMHVYAPINYPGRPLPDQPVPESVKPGLYALNLEDGTIDWQYSATPSCTEEQMRFVRRCRRSYGFSGAPTVIGDFVVTGGLDGVLYVIDKATGEAVWRYNTAREFETLNGVPGNGAAIDNASIVAVNGMLFVNSGYGLFGAGPGNVLLAFRPKKE